MKKINNIVRVLLVVVMCAGVVVPGPVFAASLSIMPIGGAGDSSAVLDTTIDEGTRVEPILGGDSGPILPLNVPLPTLPISLNGTDVRVIITNGTTNYVSNWNYDSTNSGFDVLKLDNLTTPSGIAVISGDLAYGLSYSDSHVYVAAGFDGLKVYDTDLASTATMVDGIKNFKKVVAIGGGEMFVAYFDGAGEPILAHMSYDGAFTISLSSNTGINPTTTAADITGLAVSGGHVYVAVQDNGTGAHGGYVDVRDTSDLSSTGDYTISGAVTSVAASGDMFYVGHGSNIDVVDNSDLSIYASTINAGSPVNGLATDGTNLFVATDAGLKVYKLADNSLVGEYNTDKNATAISYSGGFIYLATSDGSNSEIFKIKMVAITLNEASNGTTNPQVAEFDTTYEDPGAMADGATIYADDTSVVDMDTIGDYTVTYTSGNPGLSVTRTVQVRDTVAPVITLVGPNPQKIKHGITAVFSDIDPGATTDDGSLVTVNYSDFTDKNGTYYITYDAIDASGNHAEQVVRKVVVGSIISGSGSSGSAGGGTSNSGIDNGNQTAEPGQVLGAEKFVFTLFLKMGHSPYPIGAYANEVMELQKFLNAAPYNSGLAVDGKFGPLTKAALIKFQLANGLVGDGLVGPLTRVVLNK